LQSASYFVLNQLVIWHLNSHSCDYPSILFNINWLCGHFYPCEGIPNKATIFRLKLTAYSLQASLYKLPSFYQQMLIADVNAVGFYQSLGSERAGKTVPMWIYAGNEHYYGGLKV